MGVTEVIAMVVGGLCVVECVEEWGEEVDMMIIRDMPPSIWVVWAVEEAAMVMATEVTAILEVVWVAVAAAVKITWGTATVALVYLQVAIMVRVLEILVAMPAMGEFLCF